VYHDCVELRRLRPTDSIAELTAMLHRAYGPLAEQGMRFLASHQDYATTRERCEGGDCYVAVDEVRLVGTVTVRRPLAVMDDAPWYARPDVASMEQLGVDPSFQRRRLGSRLIELAEEIASDWGCGEIALDTSERARELIRLYEKRGYRVVARLQRDITNYASVILSKQL
jgi:GNAT superfamily N-acetyltransferase